MKSFSQFKESIIDIPRQVYAPGVFDNNDTEDPKIKISVLNMITAQFEEFEKDRKDRIAEKIINWITG